MNKTIYSKFIKRFLDILFSFILLIPSSLIIIIAAIAVAIEIKEFPFFKQARPGYKNKIFILYKIKSMKSDITNTLSDMDRISKVGSIIRKLSIDELPQLFNILKGDMSFIGPRPLLVDYLPLYTKEQLKRHNVRPGITGWAQVNGRNTLSWNDKFNYDLFYVNNVSLLLDIKIIIKTIAKLFKHSDVNASENNTMEDFDGTN